MDKDSYYFPHFYNARYDRKLRRVRKELGLEGYAIYFMTLEVLREQEDFSYPLDDIDLLADDFHTSEAKVEAVVKVYNLFEITDSRFFYSPKLIEYLRPYLEEKQQRRIDGIKGNLIRYNYATKSDLEGLTDDEIISLNHHRKEKKPILSGGESGGESGSDRKESKVKERKEEKSKYSIGCSDSWSQGQPIDYQSFVEMFNQLYDKNFTVTEDKRKNIRARLLDFTGAEILKAWEVRLKDDWLNGEDGEKFIGDWAAAMRNSEKVDRYLNQENGIGLGTPGANLRGT